MAKVTMKMPEDFLLKVSQLNEKTVKSSLVCLRLAARLCLTRLNLI